MAREKTRTVRACRWELKRPPPFGWAGWLVGWGFLGGSVGSQPSSPPVPHGGSSLGATHPKSSSRAVRGPPHHDNTEDDEESSHSSSFCDEETECWSSSNHDDTSHPDDQDEYPVKEAYNNRKAHQTPRTT